MEQAKRWRSCCPWKGSSVAIRTRRTSLFRARLPSSCTRCQTCPAPGPLKRAVGCSFPRVIHDAGELAGPGGVGRGRATRLSSTVGTRTPAKRAEFRCALQARLDRGPHGVPRGCQLSSQSCNGGFLVAHLSDCPSNRPRPQTRPEYAHLLAMLQERHRLAGGFASHPASFVPPDPCRDTGPRRVDYLQHHAPVTLSKSPENTGSQHSGHRARCRAPDHTHTDHNDQATQSSSRQGETPPEVLDDSEGKSPLIIKDLDLYPQPPTNTHSPTLNSQEPLKSSLCRHQHLVSIRAIARQSVHAAHHHSSKQLRSDHSHGVYESPEWPL